MLKQGTWLVPTLSISDFTMSNGEKSGATEGIVKMKLGREQASRQYSQGNVRGD
jgi:hypothetical protein